MTKMSQSRLERKRPRSFNCHPLIRATAVEMAASLYADLMRDNSRYTDWKTQCPELTPERLEILFIEAMVPKLLERARATLLQILHAPGNPALKPAIYDAIIKDNALRRGRIRHPRIS